MSSTSRNHTVLYNSILLYCTVLYSIKSCLKERICVLYLCNHTVLQCTALHLPCFVGQKDRILALYQMLSSRHLAKQTVSSLLCEGIINNSQ